MNDYSSLCDKFNPDELDILYKLNDKIINAVQNKLIPQTSKVIPTLAGLTGCLDVDKNVHLPQRCDLSSNLVCFTNHLFLPNARHYIKNDKMTKQITIDDNLAARGCHLIFTAVEDLQSNQTYNKILAITENIQDCVKFHTDIGKLITRDIAVTQSQLNFEQLVVESANLSSTDIYRLALNLNISKEALMYTIKSIFEEKLNQIDMFCTILDYAITRAIEITCGNLGTPIPSTLNKMTLDEKLKTGSTLLNMHNHACMSLKQTSDILISQFQLMFANLKTNNHKQFYDFLLYRNLEPEIMFAELLLNDNLYNVRVTALELYSVAPISDIKDEDRHVIITFTMFDCRHPKTTYMTVKFSTDTMFGPGKYECPDEGYTILFNDHIHATCDYNKRASLMNTMISLIPIVHKELQTHINTHAQVITIG